MLLLAALGIGVLSVPLARGRLAALADVRLRLTWLLFGALGIQILIISVIPGGSAVWHKILHFASYAMAAGFVIANRRIPGSWLIGAGGAMNVAAIAANGGIMPASASAIAKVTSLQTSGEFINSAVVSNPKLAFLGDILAVPSSWPLSNVFSVGDVCLVCGAVVAVHALSGSRLMLRARVARGARADLPVPLLTEGHFPRCARSFANASAWTGRNGPIRSRPSRRSPASRRK